MSAEREVARVSLVRTLWNVPYIRILQFAHHGNHSLIVVRSLTYCCNPQSSLSSLAWRALEAKRDRVLFSFRGWTEWFRHRTRSPHQDLLNKATFESQFLLKTGTRYMFGRAAGKCFQQGRDQPKRVSELGNWFKLKVIVLS